MVCESKTNGISYALLSLNPCFSGRWSARGYTFIIFVGVLLVLILVLVEDGLRDNTPFGYTIDLRVLILVLVEDGLRGLIRLVFEKEKLVLILVLVEDGLREGDCWIYKNAHVSVLILVLVEDGLREGNFMWVISSDGS